MDSSDEDLVLIVLSKKKMNYVMYCTMSVGQVKTLTDRTAATRWPLTQRNVLQSV